MKVIKYITLKITIYVLLVLSHILYPHRAYGKKNIPKDKPFLLYGNHTSMIDPVFVVTIFRSRKTFYMGKEELFKNPILNWYFRAIGGFPVKRGSADMRAIRECVNHIKEGNVMVIFPEGTRKTDAGDELQEFHNGASLVLHNAKADALPCYIENKKSMKMFSYSRIHIGNLVDVSEYTSKKLSSETLTACSAKLKEELEKLREKGKKI